MIVAIVLAHRLDPQIHNRPPFLLSIGDETILERVVSVALRGPFGGVVVASAEEVADDVNKVLAGFAVQQLTLNDSETAVAESVAFAADFRARWQRVMDAAAQRFSGDGKKKSAKNQPVKSGYTPGMPEHRKNPDVKVRGLARSFDRDGIVFLRADQPGLRLEVQAQIVEAFGREGHDKGAAARSIAQAVYAGQRGYPLAMTLDAAEEAAQAKLPLDNWLLMNLERVQDVLIEDALSGECVVSAESYLELSKKLNREK